ncbi:MAG: hypothetical protein QW238_00555 [Candidatus Bathyarchaeia archaeon]
MRVSNLCGGVNALGSRVRRIDEGFFEVDAGGLSYKELNTILRILDRRRIHRVRLINVEGQRYIGTGLRNISEIEVHGTPGNDMGAFMKGLKITVYGNAQDGCGNTMSRGEIIIHGSAGDILGYAMRGGKIMVKGDIGYRGGIHMKEYHNLKPIIVVGGSAGDFLGEYMAGGIIALLGLNLDGGSAHEARYVGTGMHGGVIYIHGEVRHKGGEVVELDLERGDRIVLEGLVMEFSRNFDMDPEEILDREYYKLLPFSKRPYGQLYAY